MMIYEHKIRKIAFFLVVGAFLFLVCISNATAELWFTTDIPSSVASNDEEYIIYYDSSDFTHVFLPRMPESINISALGYHIQGVFFSVDIPAEIDGITYTCRDIIFYNLNTDTYSLHLNGSAIGMPAGACIDSVTMLYDGSTIFSSDISIDLTGASYDANDLIQWKDSVLSLYLDGSSKNISEGAYIDGTYIVPSGNMMFSLDVPAELDGLEIMESDVTECDDLACSKYFDGISNGIASGINLDSFDLNVCEGDFNCDGDVDGSDAFNFKEDFGRSELLNPCTINNQCHGDFNCDGDVDGSDAALFKKDFGRSSFEDPCIVCVGEDWCVYP